MSINTGEFYFHEEENVIKKFPMKGLPPSVLAQSFRLVIASISVLSDEGVFSQVEGNTFNPPLSESAKKFTIFGERIVASVVTPGAQE